MMGSQISARYGFFTLLLLSLAGCVSSRPAVESLADVGAGEVIVVGRVDLTPPLEAADQHLDSLGSGRMKNKLYVVTDTKLRVKQGPVSSGDEYFETVLGEPFYIKGGNKPFYMLEGVIYTEASQAGVESVYLPGGLKVDVQPNDKAVYIGKLHYVRNEYFDIVKAEIVDDYDRANAAFKKKFGAKYNLRKALAVPVRQKM